MKRTRLKRKTQLKRGGRLAARSKPKTLSDLARQKRNPHSAYWRNKADDLWGWIVRNRNGGRSERSGNWDRKLDAHHLIHRNRHMTRHCLENGICLTVYEHRFADNAPHGADSWRFADWLQTQRPETWAWMQKHKNDQGRADYAQAYENLLAAAKKMNLVVPDKLRVPTLTEMLEEE